MRYLLKTEYKIVLQSTYKIIRNCAGCKSKSNYVNTGNFRVNASGNKIDVWLIYQCEKCKHTYNLTVYERIKPTDIPQDDYKKFLANDKGFALHCGMDKGLLAKNKALTTTEGLLYRLQEIVWEGITKESVTLCLEQNLTKESEGKIKITIDNPYGLKVRNDKLVCEILQISRSKAKKLLEEGQTEIII